METIINDEMLDDFFAFLNEKYENAEDSETENYDAFDPETQYVRAYKESMNNMIHFFDYIKHKCKREDLDFTARDILKHYTNFLNREVFALRLRAEEIPEGSIIRAMMEGQIAPYEMVLNELRFMGITADAGSLHG